MLDRDFHVLEFEGVNDAAAFIAALSRFLNSPVGSTYVDSTGAMQVWCCVSAAGVAVFLSPDALDAASAAFAPVLVSGTRRGDEFPAESRLMIDGDNVPAWGLNEVEYMLIRGQRERRRV